MCHKKILFFVFYFFNQWMKEVIDIFCVDPDKVFCSQCNFGLSSDVDNFFPQNDSKPKKQQSRKLKIIVVSEHTFLGANQIMRDTFLDDFIPSFYPMWQWVICPVPPCPCAAWYLKKHNLPSPSWNVSFGDTIAKFLSVTYYCNGLSYPIMIQLAYFNWKSLLLKIDVHYNSYLYEKNSWSKCLLL